MSLIDKLFSSNKNKSVTSDSVVGIDIGSSSVKVVEIQDREGVLTLVTYGEVQLGPYVGKPIGETVTLDSKQEQEAIVDVIRESAVKTRSAVFATPLSSSFVTNVSIEADAEEDLGPMVIVEARKVIPASLNEITLDWAEVEVTTAEQESSEKNFRNVLIAAIQNSTLERFKMLMMVVGLDNPPNEIECFSTIRGLHDAKKEDVAIIDIGAVTAKLYIVKKGSLMRMYRIRAGGTVATKEIAKVLNVGFDEAEQIKITADKTAENFAEVKRAHNASYDRAFREFYQVLDEYEKRTGITIGSVYLTGGGSLFPGMEAHLKGMLNRNVSRANPFSKVAYPAFMEDTMNHIGPSFSVALGAALRTLG